MSLRKNLIRLWGSINSRRKKHLLSLLVLTLFASFAEVVSIGAVLPFLAVLADPDQVYNHPLINPIAQQFEITSPEGLIMPMVILFGLSAIFAGTMRLSLLKVSTHLTFAIGHDLSLSVYKRTLYQPYSVHISRNSSQIITAIAAKITAVIFGVVMPILLMISSAFMLLSILMALLVIEPQIAMIALFSFGLIYALIIFQTQNRVKTAGESIAHESTMVIKSMQEGLGGIRDILLDGSQVIYANIYRDADLSLRKAQRTNQFIKESPRYIVETLGMLIIAAAASLFTQEPGGIARAIPILGALALGAQRMLPVLQQGYSAWSSLKGSLASLVDVLELLEQPMPEILDEDVKETVSYKKVISFENVCFAYSKNHNLILDKINLEIPKGSQLGITGETGSGKSTFLDLIMGLLVPTSGSLSIDNIVIGKSNIRSWQSQVAHVPQSIFLTDNSIAENIAFGVKKSDIDIDRVKTCAETSQIAHTIESLDQKYETRVGERGVKLSGGQRQRIGIARALYKKADVIIFDEATSALDTKTEEAVMNAINRLSKELTIIIVAHRISTLENCTHLIEIKNGSIKIEK